MEWFEALILGLVQGMTEYLPNKAEPIVKCPLLLTGKYSVIPCTRPKINASNHSIYMTSILF